MTSIGGEAFNGCIGLTSVRIPGSVQKIDYAAFYKCTGIKELFFEDGDNVLNLSYNEGGGGLFTSCPIETLYIGRTLSYPDPVEGLGYYSGERYRYSPFENRTTLKSLTIGASVQSIGNYEFYGCNNLESVEILGSSIRNVGQDAFSGCNNLKTLKVSSLKAWCSISFANPVANPLKSGMTFCDFYNRELITSDIIIPDSVTTIGDYAFCNVYNIQTITLPNNIVYIGEKAFNAYYATRFYVSKGTKSMLTVWNRDYFAWNKETLEPFVKPSIYIRSVTQTSVKGILGNRKNYPEYKYSYNGVELLSDTIELTGLYPQCSDSIRIKMSLEDVGCIVKTAYRTRDISPRISLSKKASSISASGTYIIGDANVTSQTIKINGESVNDSVCTITGLDPDTPYKAEYSVNVLGNSGQIYTYTDTMTVKTDSLILNPQQPKVISVGNVIVDAKTNLDDEETNVGFEWRRTDWTDEFASNTGKAYLYDGEMEGYIRNLYAEKLWKFRPYYLSKSGTYHYGEWLGLDPTNTSYFEPTVHTYDKITVDGNTALIKGYALRGTDGITVQGFKYWPIDSEAKARGAVQLQEKDIPEDAMTVTAKGQVMTASLKNLRYSTEYCYVAFVETSENETFYGEMQTFTTGRAAGDLDGDGHITVDDITLLIAVYLGETTNSNADIDGDGQITVEDVTTLIELYLQFK